MTKLLLVDDNEQNLYMLQVLLEGSGYEVILAKDGVEALEKARRAPPDVIITDILMPVMDGFTLCRKWKKDAVLKTIPFVFYTATYADPKDEELALRLGAERFIRKPMEPAAFAEILRKVIREAEAGRLVAPREPVKEERIFLKEYNEALIRKLEDKMLQLEQANRRLTVLYQVSTSLAAVKPLGELASHALLTVVEAMGYTRANYFTFEEGEQTFYLSESVGFPDEILTQFQQELVFRLGEERGLVGLVGQRQEPLILTDTKRDPRWITVDETIRSALFVPVAHEGHLLGVISFLSTETGTFTDEDAKDVMTLANNLAIAIKNAQLFEQAQQEIAERKQAEEALRKSEERLRAMLEGIGDMVLIIDKDLNVQWANKVAIERYGETIGNKCYEVYKGRKKECGKCLVRDTLADGKVHSSEKEGRLKDGTPVHYLVTASPMRDKDGSIIAVVEVLTDITKRVRAEEGLKRSLEKLQKAKGSREVSRSYKKR